MQATTIERLAVIPDPGVPVTRAAPPDQAWTVELAQTCGDATDALELVELGWPEPGPTARGLRILLDEARALAGPATAVVGHGLGGLVALHLGSLVEMGAAVALCTSPHPDRDAPAAAALLTPAVIPACPTLLVLGTGDRDAPAAHWVGVARQGPPPKVVLIDRCPRRFMDAPVDRTLVLGTVAAFLTAVIPR